LFWYKKESTANNVTYHLRSQSH